jgi:hypothetical protein
MMEFRRKQIETPLWTFEMRTEWGLARVVHGYSFPRALIVYCALKTIWYTYKCCSIELSRLLLPFPFHDACGHTNTTLCRVSLSGGRCYDCDYTVRPALSHCKLADIQRGASRTSFGQCQQVHLDITGDPPLHVQICFFF